MAERFIKIEDGRVLILNRTEGSIVEDVVTPDIDSMSMKSLLALVDDALGAMLGRDDISVDAQRLLARGFEATSEVRRRVGGV